MSKKTLIITAIIVALIATGATAAFITIRQGGEEVRQEQPVVTLPEAPKERTTQPGEPTVTEPIDTSDWKTYRNEKYGFELQYPSNFFIDVEKENEVHFVQGSNQAWILSIYVNRRPDIGQREQFPYKALEEGQTISGTYILVEDPITIGPDVFHGWVVSDRIPLQLTAMGLPFDTFRQVVLSVVMY